MEPERWQRIESLYHAALERAPAERSGFLAEACAGDESLRADVESLLEVEPRGRSFIETPALAVAEPIPSEPLHLSAGEAVGPYQVVSLLGRGGMGEVYRARDSRLGREVALKVMPVPASSDADRLNRFEQEARAASRLSHPNIVAIYDVGDHHGAPYLVSELLDGRTLREVLEPGPLPVRKAIEYARQSAKGLAAAHAKGIVHRDLKPENLFITRDGRVKILDFGIAKLIRPEEKGAVDPTAAHTRQGMILGTLGYMAPEQLRGEPVDARADLFAFGAICHEMLTGRPAFRRGSAAETVSAILKEDPPEIPVSILGFSPGLERAIRRCLEKDREERFQSASDLAFALDALSTRSGPLEIREDEVPGPPTSRHPRHSGAEALPSGKLRGLTRVAAIASLLVGAFLVGRRTVVTPPTSSPNFQRLTFRRGNLANARIAPDGQTVVYGAAWEGRPIELFTTRLGNAESRAFGLPETDVAAISATGELAVLRKREGRSILARLPLVGGTPRDVLEGCAGADWTPDGRELAVLHVVNGNTRIEFPVGRVLYQARGIFSIRFSPRGDVLAFSEPEADGRRAVAVVDLAGGKRTLSRAWKRLQGLAWSPGGEEVWFTASETGAHGLHAVSLGGGQRLLARVPGKLAVQDVSRDGRVLIEQDLTRTSMMSLRGRTENGVDLSWFDASTVRDLSADGRTVLFDERGEGGGESGAVYLRSTDGGPAVRLGQGSSSALSPDGRWVLALAADQTPAPLVLMPTGPGETKTLERGPVRSYVPYSARWFPDGRRVLFAADDAEGNRRLFVQDVSHGAPRSIAQDVGSGPISPDGKWTAAVGPDRVVALQSLEGKPARPLPGIERGETPVRFSADGRFLYLIRSAGLPALVVRYELASARREVWREIAPPDPDHVSLLSGAQLTPDGLSMVYSYGNVLSTLYLLEGVR